MYSLFKEACRSHQGKLVKDLSSLNRDPKKVIVLDTESDGFMLQPENGILVKPWKGEKGDRELMGLLNFLESEFETIRTHSNLFTKLRVHDLSLPPSLFSQQLVSTVSQTSERLQQLIQVLTFQPNMLVDKLLLNNKKLDLKLLV